MDTRDQPALPAQTPRPFEELESALREAFHALSGQPLDPTLRLAVENLRVEVRRGIEALAESRDKEQRKAACVCVELLIEEGWVLRFPVEGETPKIGGWPGKLASLLERPAWELGEVGRLDDLPFWLWPTFCTAFFRLPSVVQEGPINERVLGHYQRRLGELERLAKANRGSAAVRAALEKQQARASIEVLAGMGLPLREILRARASLRRLSLGLVASEPALCLPREGRKLRVGFLLDGRGEGARLRGALPWLEGLDRDRYDHLAFLCAAQEINLLSHLGEYASEVKQLSGELTADLQVLRDAALDVLVFFTHSAGEPDLVYDLAQYRLAPLQVAIDALGLSTGLETIDLSLAPEGAEPSLLTEHFSERFACPPVQGWRMDTQSLRPQAGVEWTREGLQLAPEEVLFACLSPFAWVSPEWLQTCAEILHRLPQARLLVYSGAKADAALPPLADLLERFLGALSALGIGEERLILSNEAFPSVSEVLALLAVADVYLEAFPAAEEQGLRLALEAGLPVVACAAQAGGQGRLASTLRHYGLGSSLAESRSAYVARALALGSDSVFRRQEKELVRASLAAEGNQADVAVQGVWFGRLLEAAFDEVLTLGGTGLRPSDGAFVVGLEGEAETALASARAALAAYQTDEAEGFALDALCLAPRNGAARLAYYEVLLAKGSANRAAHSLVSAVYWQGQRADLWFLLARALRQSGKRDDAIKALEMALRLDGSNLEAWYLLREIATEAGHFSMLDEIQTVVAKLEAEGGGPGLGLPRF